MQPEAGQQDEGNWTYKPGDETKSIEVPPVPEQHKAPAEDFKWNASEYVTHQNGLGWYVLVLLATVVMAAIIYFLTVEWISVVVVIIMGFAFAAFSARQPRVQEYGISESGVQVGKRFHEFKQFKSFSVMREGAMGYISLMPVKRFIPPVAMYYAPEDEDKIVNALADFLPYEQREHDSIDRLTRKIRF